jgi:protein arginine kinase activator
MICQDCGTREATVVVQTVISNHVTKAALCSTCAADLEPVDALDALMQAMAGLTSRTRAHPARCATCRTSFASFRETGRFGCGDCYEHFLPQVKDLLPRLHSGAYQHRGKTPGRR